MPVDEQTTRRTKYEPKSSDEAEPQGSEGESGVPPTVKQPTKPTSRPPTTPPPPSIGHKIDASVDKTRTQAAANDLEPALLTNRTGGQAMIAKQRRDAVSISVADSAKRILNSLYTTDVFPLTDATLVEWFRKDNFERHQEARSAVPFFSTPSLAEMMLKDKPTFKRDMELCTSKLAKADGPELEELLIVLTELIYEHFAPSVPTLVKLSVYFLTNTERITDNMMIGLDDGSNKVGLTTTLIENYYQVRDYDLYAFQQDECNEGRFVTRPTLGGNYEDSPGYNRLCAERIIFTNEDTAAAYDDTWNQFWVMLKSVLCSHSETTPDIDLAKRRRIINGDPNHPLRQQYTASGLEPDRIWLDRYRRADSAAIDFEKRMGFRCGLDLDDMGHIDVATDAMHECLLDLFDDELVKLGAENIKVPRTNYAGVLQKDRLLPKISWQAWKTAYSAAYKSFKALINKKSYPYTKATPIVSRMTDRSTLNIDGDKVPSDGNKTKACRWCKSTEHFTDECQSEGRRTAGVCKAYQRGKCRQGARHCKYLHIKPHNGLSGQTPEANLTNDTVKDLASQSQSALVLNSGGQNSSNTSSGTTQKSPAMDQKSPPVCTDDFTKPADRICNVPGCAKPFHLALEGDYGVKWYGQKGMFLPRRCDDCIKAGKTKGPPNGQKPYNATGNSQTQMCDMHDPEAVDTLLCGFDPDALDLTNRFQKLTLSWCTRCGAHYELDQMRSLNMLCANCFTLDGDNEHHDHDELVITPPPAESMALMIEISDSSAASSLSSELELEVEQPAIGLPDTHGVHTAILRQWSGLELHPSAFTTACEMVCRYFVDGCSDSDGSFCWDGLTIDPTGEVISRLFKLICKSPHSEGVTADQLELAYGLGSALHELTSPPEVDSVDTAASPANTTQSTPPRSCMPESPISGSSSDGSFSAHRAAEPLSQYEGKSIAQTKPKRSAACINRFEPSPSGIRQETVSAVEFFAAVIDSDLEDASIGSSNSNDSHNSSLSDFR